MARISFLARADDDLFEIWDYIAADSVASADSVIDAIASKIDHLASFPQMGPSRDDIISGGRLLVHGRYLVIYEFDEAADLVTILTVVEGSRDLTRLF